MWRRISSLGFVMKRKADILPPIPPTGSRLLSQSLSPGPTSPTPKRAKKDSATMPVTTKIDLSPRESQLRSLLCDVASAINEIPGAAPEPVVLRWAGGWVRDKLLGVESHDIDVAINSMTGSSFASRMRDYCDTPLAKEKHSIAPSDVGNLHNVAANPEKSKHLETAMVRMFGLDLDFVNLRKETYAQDSRNPQMEFGTAEEDALRRDATINALFYNLHEDCVEDFTGGLRDMDKGIIRTPMEPLQTFKDDPLRVLRLVRFASRLGFQIDEETSRFMDDRGVLDALTVKISRERVGVELEKMLKGKRPRSALQLIHKYHLYQAIFTDPTSSTPISPDTSHWPVTYDCLHALLQNPSPASIGSVLVHTPDEAYTAWNLAAFSPWMGVAEATAAANTKKAKRLHPVTLAAREGIKAPNKLSDVISAAYRNRGEIMELKQAVCAEEGFVRERDRVGMAIRRWDVGGQWRLQVLSALLFEAMQIFERWDEPASKAKQDDFLSQWQKFLDHISDLDLFDAPNLKRLVDGKTLSAALGVKPGVWTGPAMEVCVAWQLRHPGETDPAGVIEEIRSRAEELKIPLPK